MKCIFHILSLVLVLPKFLLAEGEPKDTTRLKMNTHFSESLNISKIQLISLVDSLLELDVIEDRELALITYHNSFISSKEISVTLVKCSNIPASNFYDDFDEKAVFQITPQNEFVESQIIEIESDSLGVYNHPRIGQINSKFGWRDGRMHKGVDINLHKGDAVVAAFDGMVRIASIKGGYGNVIVIRHYNGLETVYGHLSKIKVKPGQVVLAGQLIGLGGNTGRSTGPHLHFEIRFKGHALDPASIISFIENKTFNDSIIIKNTRYGICAYPSNAAIHTVERGDTWYEVAKRYGLSMKELCVLNNTDKRYYLKVGQKLRVH